MCAGVYTYIHIYIYSLLLKLDRRFPIERFEATACRSAVPSPPLRTYFQLDPQ